MMIEVWQSTIRIWIAKISKENARCENFPPKFSLLLNSEINYVYQIADPTTVGLNVKYFRQDDARSPQNGNKLAWSHP